MKAFILFICAALCVQNIRAQFIPGAGDDKIIVTPNIAPVKTILKFSLLSPFEARSSIRAAGEFTIGKQWSIQPEVGYIYNYLDGIYKIRREKPNFEVRLALRYYIPEKFFNGLYAGPVITYSGFNYLEGVWKNVIPSMPDSLVLDYSNPWKYTETDMGIYLLAGIQPSLSRHFNVDIGVGFGAERKTIKTIYDPSLASGAPLPAPSIAIKPQGIITLHAGYVF